MLSSGNCTVLSSSGQPSSNTRSSQHAAAAPLSAERTGQHEPLASPPITRIIPLQNQHSNACISQLVPSSTQLTPILPAPTAEYRPHPMASSSAGAIQFLPSSGPAVPLYAQNPLGLLLAKLNGGYGSTADRFSVPIIFQGQKQRSGKWIPEEEEFAAVLIKLFEKGFLFDCENGSTLRSYLSRKLHCAPMRISKKYAGQGIGKMLFICRIRLNMSILAPCTEDIKLLERRANEKELLFYRAVFPEKMLPDPRELLASTSGLEGHAQVPAPVIFPALSGGGSAGTPMPVQSQPGPIMVASAPMPSVTAAGTGALTAALQQSFFNALQQVAVKAGADTSNLQFVPAPQHSQPIQLSNIPSIQPVASSHNPQGYELSFNPPMQTTSSAVPPGLALSPMWMPSCSPLPNPVGPKKLNTSQLSPVPDFLAGFDKVKLAMKPDSKPQTVHTTSEGHNNQYSPPFTSRSFDDFHRFLGEDLAPLGSPVFQRSQESARSASPLHSYDPETIFSLRSNAESHQQPAYLWPGGRSSQISQAAPISSQCLVPQHQEPVLYLQSATAENGEKYETLPLSHSVAHMNDMYGEQGAATVSEHDESGRSSVNRSGSDQDIASAMSQDFSEESDDPEWEDQHHRVRQKRKRGSDDNNDHQPPRANATNSRSKSKIHAIG